MNLYEFRGAIMAGNTIVRAEDEKTAREKAMIRRWGPPDGIICHHPYKGRGLTLIEVKEGV
jgi:hypothetical protein